MPLPSWIVDRSRWLCLLAPWAASALACVHAPPSSLPPAPAQISIAPAQAAAAPQTLAAYCDAASKRRALFTPSVSVEMRSVSLLAREGDEPRALTAAEQVAYGAPQIFVGRTNAVTAADLDAAEIRPGDLPKGGYDVLVFVKPRTAVKQRLLPMVGGLVGAFVDGRLISLAKLIGAPISYFPAAMQLTLPEALASAARFSPPMDTAGLEHLEQRCLDGEAALCVPLAEERLIGRDAPYDTQRAALLFEQACGLGLGGACERRAELATDRQQVIEWLQRGCQANNPNACYKLGELLVHRDDIAQGKANLAHACDQGVGRACTALVGVLEGDYKGHARPPHEVEQAIVGLLERGCSEGDASACFTLADFSRRGLVGPADLAAAKRWLHAGCVLDPTGAGLYAEIMVGAANRSLTADLAEAGCSDGFPPRAPPRRPLCAPLQAHE